MKYISGGQMRYIVTSIEADTLLNHKLQVFDTFEAKFQDEIESEPDIEKSKEYMFMAGCVAVSSDDTKAVAFNRMDDCILVFDILTGTKLHHYKGETQ